MIGNGKYDHLESLANPANDSATMRDKLSNLGFELYGGDDLTRKQFVVTLEKFRQAAKNAGTVMIYYSGHGFQLNGVNYLVPSDAELRTASAIESQTIRLDRLIGDLQASDQQLLVFLDACRNNPLPPAQRQNNGLAQIETGSNDVFVAFATQPGNISYDGRSRLSPFTRAVTQEMSVPGQTLSDMMIKVRNEVQKRTLYQQTPWEQSSLTKQFFFSAPAAGPTETSMVAVAPGALGEDVPGASRSTDIERYIHDELALARPNVLTLPGAMDNSSVILLPEAPIELFGNETLLVNVQTELKRVGCYLGEVDGVWSQASSEALSRYFAAKKMRDLKAAPNETDLGILQRELGRVCRPPAVERRPSAGAGQGGQRRSNVSGARRGGGGESASGKSGSRRSREAYNRPAAPKPRQIENTRMMGAFR